MQQAAPHAAYPPGMAAPPPNGGGGGPPPGSAAGGGVVIPDSYFTESRKGEINELRNLLRGFATERDPQRKREIIKKVIAYMTLGIDVSRLFTEMMLAIETRDLVIKKMIYLYLTNYARSHPDLAQMCTNTLQKDCGNEDPMVRGLALRALCGLNLPQMVEYISEPLRRSLSDGHPYVRKTGVMGILKLHDLDPEMMPGFVDILYDMLRDPDASVVCNCIIVLNEVMQKNGGMAMNRAIMLHLLNRIHEFNEFAKVQVLELVPRYIPANDEEGFQIMNLLDPVLRTSGSAAVMATMRAFLSLAEQLGDDSMKRQIVTRVKAPLVTQISSGTCEMMYTLLKHVETLCDITPGVFDDEYRQFYVRYNEPTHVQYLKITILPKLANPDTAPDIVSELAECVGSPNARLARLAVRSMAQIACSGQGGPGAAEAIARRLVDLLDWSADVVHVSSEAATALAMLIRKHDSSKPLMAPYLVRSLRYSTEASGKASLIFLLGECGDLVPEAPYALERVIDSYDELTDATIKIALLTATVKLFFQRPPEVQRMLGRLLHKACDDVSSQDLHDRALMYYRLLKSGAAAAPQTLEQVLSQSTSVTGGQPFSEEDTVELRRELMAEFNTLSVLYGRPSVLFIAPEYQVKFVQQPPEHPLEPLKRGGGTGVPPNPLEPATAAPAAAAEVDLLGFGGSGGSAPPPAAAAAVAVASSSSGGLSLNPHVTLTGEEYQTMWGATADSDATVEVIPLPALPSSTDQVEQALDRFHIKTMASGELPTEFKFFLYAQDDDSMYYLIQSNLDKTTEPCMIVTIKTTSGGGEPDAVRQLVELLTNALK